MGWKEDLHRLDACFDRAALADYIGVSVSWINKAFHDGRSTSAEYRWKVREALERLKGEHAAAHEVAIYALQQADQLRQADSMQEVEDILDRTVPMLEYKAEGLMDDVTDET